MTYQSQNILVIGGGFYGCSIAEYLAHQGANVTLVEQATELLTRASYRNQARLHQGYHYPRSFGTAFRSRYNFKRFLQDYRPAITTDFTKLYAIARTGSKVSPRQFEVFCKTIEAPLNPATTKLSQLFCPRLVEAVYETVEYAFNAAILRQILLEKLEYIGVKIRLSTKIVAIEKGLKFNQMISIDNNGNTMVSDFVFNCTYSGLNSIQGISSTKFQLKHEIAELTLIELPPELEKISVTVMDGSFFSFMPFPDRKLSTFTHVRYTPHMAWLEAQDDIDSPYDTLNSVIKNTSFEYMIRDAGRYIPSLRNAVYHDSLFEVKTILCKNEWDDGRPMLFESNVQYPQFISVLGSKIDNIYDVFTAVDRVANR